MSPLHLPRGLVLAFLSALGVGFVDVARGQPSPAAVSMPRAAAAGADDFPALRVAVASVNESRNNQGRGTLNLNLSILGEGLSPNALVKQVTVTKAVDNLGNVLSSSASGANSAASLAILESRLALSLSSSGRGGPRPLTGSASLAGSVRKAESLQYVEGTIDLFLPSEANGSIVRIPNVLSHAGRIENPTLAKHGIEFYFLPDQASYDEAEAAIAAFRTPPRVPDFPNGVGYFVRDPSGLIANQQLQQANGTVIPPRGNSRSGGTGSIHLSAPLPADAQLVFFLMIAEGIKTVPFRVEDIALP
jgi:hypothetical protein